MSNLLFVDSFTHYTISQMGGKQKWTTASGGSLVPARYTNNGFKGGTASFTITAASEVTVGFAWKPSAATDNLPIKLLSAANVGFMFQAKGDGTIFPIVTTPGGNTSGTGPSWAQSPGIWYYIEFQTTVAPTTTTYTLKINGNSVLTGTIGVGDASGYTSVNIINVGGIISDLYVTDTAFLGDVRIIPCFASSDGDTIQWTPLSGVTHYNEVNDNPPDDDTTYNYATGNFLDLYHLANIVLTPSPSILGAQIVACLRGVAATYFAKTAWKSGGTEVDSAAFTRSSGSYLYALDPRIQNPIGPAAWTLSAFNALQAGVKITSVANSTMTFTVPGSSVYMMQFGVNLGNFTQSVHPSNHSSSVDITLAGGWIIEISGPKIGGGTQVKTITVGAGSMPSTGTWSLPSPWFTTGIYNNNPSFAPGQAAQVPNAITSFISQADGFALNSGDVITITYLGGLFSPGGSNGSSQVITNFQSDWFMTGPSGYPTAATIGYDPTTCSGYGNYWCGSQCNPSGGNPILMFALLACFTQHWGGPSPAPGDPQFWGGNIVGTPFAVNFGNGYTVP